MFRVAPIYSRNQFGGFLNDRNLTGEAVEIGTHRGAYARILLDSWNGKMLHCVDPWSNLPGYESQAKLLPGLGGDGVDRRADYLACRVELCKDRKNLRRFRCWDETSAVSAGRFSEQRSLDFVYIDGDHRREHVAADLIRWWPLVANGGILAGHDWIQPGETHRWADDVQRGVEDFLNHLMTSGQGAPDIWLIVEEGGLPWTFYMEKQTTIG